MKRGRMTTCRDCGARMKAPKRVIRPLCRRCAIRHRPFRKTKAIINLYEGRR